MPVGFEQRPTHQAYWLLIYAYVLILLFAIPMKYFSASVIRRKPS